MIITEELINTRLDIAVCQINTQLTRSMSQKLIANGSVTVNDKASTNKYKLKANDNIQITIPPPVSVDIAPKDIPLDIIYQDKDIAIINKPQGMVVHPAAGHTDDTLVNAIMYVIKDLSGIGGELRPGIVHRIDKDTSGLLLIAKNDHAHLALSKQLKDKTMNREYICITYGHFKDLTFEVDAPIARHKTDRKKMAIDKDGRNAKTIFTVIDQNKDYALVHCKLTTGRTHQIRVHLQSTSHPIVGDMTYGIKKPKIKLNGQCLHAYKLTLIHPTTNDILTFFAPLPDIMINICEKQNLDTSSIKKEINKEN